MVRQARGAAWSTGRSGLIGRGAVPDLDVLRAHEARQANQMISLSGATGPGAGGPEAGRA